MAQVFSHWKRKWDELPKSHWKFSGVELFFWFSWAATGYLSVFLQGRGMTAAEVGVIGALNSAVGIVASPIWGVVSDKWRSVRKVLFLCAGIGALTWAFVPSTIDIPIAGPITLGLLMIPLSSFFRMPSSSLMESWVVQNANKQKLNYGSMRIWGSISYAVMNVGLTAIIPYIGVESTFWIFLISVAPLCVLCVTIKDDAVKVKSRSLKEMNIGALFKDSRFACYLLFGVFLNMPVNTIFTFMPYLMTEAAVSTDLFGLVSAIRATFEIPTLLLCRRLRLKIPLPYLLLMACGLYVIESSLYTFISGLIPLLLAQSIHGLASGLFIGCSSNYIYQLAPEGLKATAQTVNGSCNSMAGIIGSSLGGFLLDLVGVRSFYLVAACLIGVSGLFFLLTLYLDKKKGRAAEVFV